MSAPPASALQSLEMLRKLGGDPFVARLASTFLGVAHERVAAIVAGAGVGASEATVRAAAEAAHAMKSGAGQIGAHALADACAAAERAARAGDPAALMAAASTVEAAFADARAWVQGLADS